MANFTTMRNKGAVIRRMLASFALSTATFSVVNTSCLQAKKTPIPVVQVLEEEIEIRYGPPEE